MPELFAQVILSGFNTCGWECGGKVWVWGKEVMQDGAETVAGVKFERLCLPATPLIHKEQYDPDCLFY